MSERIARVLEATLGRLESEEMASNRELFVTAFPGLSDDEREELMTTLLERVAEFYDFELDYEPGFDQITKMLFTSTLLGIVLGAQMRDMSMAGTL